MRILEVPRSFIVIVKYDSRDTLDEKTTVPSQKQIY